MDFNEIIQFISEPDFDMWWLSLLKIVFLSMGLVYMGFIVYMLLKTSWMNKLMLWDLREILTYRHFGLAGVAKKWVKIKEKFNLDIEDEAKLAIIESDNLLNGILKEMGYGGETLGEKLDKLTPELLSNLEQVRQAHKIRSDIVHDPSYHLHAEDGRTAMATYEQALINLQAF